ncbi:MAG: hypothetical protein OXE75_11125 [bacterium]|nr:hypothetical protein [bacterium]
MRLPLDENFPEPILEALERWMGDIQLLPLRTIDPRLTGLDDRRLLIGLSQLGFEGLVTLNYKMLRNPSELAAVLKTRMTIFAIDGVGHDPIRATGALLLDLPPAVAAMRAGGSGVFWLRPRSPKPHDPWELFKTAAERRNDDAASLYESLKVSDDEMETAVLASGGSNAAEG